MYTFIDVIENARLFLVGSSIPREYSAEILRDASDRSLYDSYVGESVQNDSFRIERFFLVFTRRTTFIVRCDLIQNVLEYEIIVPIILFLAKMLSFSKI